MTKNFKKYAICWAILLAVFNVICFAIPSDLAGYEKFGGAFWAGYIFISLAFIGQLACAFFAFKASEDKQKMFYNIPLITISYAGLILMLVVGGLCMAIPDLPNWLGVIVCVLVLAFTAISVIKASAAADVVEEVDNKVKTKTAAVKKLISDAEILSGNAKSAEAKAECKKVYEALRYSDPVSSDDLSLVEAKITVKLSELSAALTADDIDKIKSLASEALALINERSIKCKNLK